VPPVIFQIYPGWETTAKCPHVTASLAARLSNSISFEAAVKLAAIIEEGSEDDRIAKQLQS